MPSVSTERSVAVEKNGGKRWAREPRLDVLILLSNTGCQTLDTCDLRF